MPKSIPDKVGKYEIRGLVGRGAMGVVYSAVDPALGRPVAIKTMSIAESPHEAELRLRFLREAQAAGQLQHPNIITVHELFEEGDTAYLVMELLEGASLSSILRRKRRMSLGEKLSIIDQIAAGLSEAHAHRIVHRDLKPSNVFVLRSGVVKVLDFGVAKVGEGELTKAGTVFGTVEYMAPEQVRGQSVTPHADIFSLGVVSYEILTGHNPFRADTLAASVFKIVSDDPAKLSERDATVPVEVETVVFRSLSKSMDDRFQSMAELRAALKDAAKRVQVPFKPLELVEDDVVVTKDRGDSAALSVEPQISQWSNVAAQADLLEDIYQQGVEAFNEGAYEDCVLKMSQVLDEVPVHAMSLHYLASSEEKLRRQRLDDDARQQATSLLTRMRNAHRGGDSDLVMETANALLRIDPESMEARWYRRNAEARLRAATVGGRPRPSAASGSRQEHRGTFSRAGGSFGYTPSVRGSLSPAGAEVRPEQVAGTLPEHSASSSKGLWILGSVALLFVGLIGMWISSLGEQDPAVSADPITLPGVRESPFVQGIDEDGTVVLDIPIQRAPAATTFSIRYVIPTTIEAGRTATVGLFGTGFPEDADVTVSEDGASILSISVRSPEHIEIEILVESPHDALAITVGDAQGQTSTIELEVTP